MIAEGKIDPSPVLTGVVGLPGVGRAFDELASPDRHAKILIDPASSAADAEPVLTDGRPAGRGAALP